MRRESKRSLLLERLKAKAYRHNAPLFMEIECGLKPSRKQADFLKAMEDLDLQQALLCASANSGKTVLIAVLAIWSCTVLPYDLKRPYEVAILGGSGEQAKRAYRWVLRFILHSDWIASKVKDEPRVERTDLTDGSLIQILKCSETSVRGVHPDCIILDEAASIPEPLAKAGLIRVDASLNPRAVLDSTPHIYYSLFVEYWLNHKKYGFKKFGWNAYDCPWIPKSRIDKRRERLDSRTFAIEYLADPTPLLGNMIQATDLQKSIVPDTRPEIEGKIVLAVDWGKEHPTAFGVWQKQGLHDVNLFCEERTQFRFSVIHELIKSLHERYKIDVIIADRSHIGENERLQEVGYYVKQMPFIKENKERMKSYSQARFETGMVKIPVKSEQLIKELTTYTDIGKEKDDNVDTMLMAVWELKEYRAEGKADMISGGVINERGGRRWRGSISSSDGARRLL